MIVDFHVHSTASDGTFAPKEIMDRARHVGFAAIALTDHDNCDGVEEFRSSGGIAGVELSIDPGKGFDKFHLLGLGINPNCPLLTAFLARVLEKRNERNERILENFRRLGFEMASTIADYAHGDVLARPHFARWLMDRGHVRSISEAFALYLADDAPKETRCYEERWRPDQEEAIRVIHEAGGLAIMAHPRYWRSTWKVEGVEPEVAARGIAEVKEKGLDGVEALYQANTIEENILFTRLAENVGLLKSAGSDFHGENKPTIPLGMTVPDRFIAPLLERLSI